MIKGALVQVRWPQKDDHADSESVHVQLLIAFFLEAADLENDGLSVLWELHHCSIVVRSSRFIIVFFIRW